MSGVSLTAAHDQRPVSTGRIVRAAFAGGGSGGHLFPAIAIVRRLLERAPDFNALFVTSSREVDQTVLQSAALPSARVETEILTALRAKDAVNRPWEFWPAMAVAAMKARTLLKRFQPQFLVGLGGIASAPTVLAARWLRIPVVLLEHNVVPGRATRRLARFANITCTGLPMEAAFATAWPGPIRNTGVPLRSDIERMGQQQRQSENGPNADRLPESEPTLLILGGSQGASRINFLVRQMISENNAVPQPWRIIHQTGPADADSMASYYRSINRRAEVFPFLADMGDVLRQATVVVGRAGAITVAELACAAKPAILIPYHRSSDQHQQKNAWWLESRTAALVIDEQSSDAVQRLAAAVRSCTASGHVRQSLSEAIHRVAVPHATENVIAVLEQLPGVC